MNWHEDASGVYAKVCPRCQCPSGPTAIVCAGCQGSLKGVPLTHGSAAPAEPRAGRRWDLAMFVLLGGLLLTVMAVMLCGLMEQVALGIGLAIIMGVVTVLVAALAAAPLRALDEDHQWGTSALFVLMLLLAMMVVAVPVICMGVIYSQFE